MTMAASSISMSQQQKQQGLQIEGQRPYSTSQPIDVNNVTFSRAADLERNRAQQSTRIDENENKLGFFPASIAVILGSTYCLIILSVLLIFPILELAIGAAYINQCPVSPNIPIYLIVTGVCGMTSILLILAIVVALIYCIKRNSLGGSIAMGGVITCILIFILIMSVFLFAWFIAGNVWVFGAKNVSYDNTNPTQYCNRTLYQFAYAMLIIAYIMMGISCCSSCIRGCFRAKNGLQQ